MFLLHHRQEQLLEFQNMKKFHLPLLVLLLVQLHEQHHHHQLEHLLILDVFRLE
tara:strand:- start:598 stop:759 length:162 start_codon:yes stop_codon:yes gene_type:complete